MTFIKSISAGAFALASAAMFAMPANAAPVSIVGSGNIAKLPQPGAGLVHKVSGCHANRAHHMVFKWGYQAWHRHGPGCQPLPVVSGHCHRNYNQHFHPGFGGGWHKHVGPRCVPFRGRVWQSGPRHGCVQLGGVWICG